ncbi:MAG: ATP-binding protein [Rhodobacteraceae bacterium]|nr:ATP-binding protein [Paracoccaceae bacterium]MCY4251184.1 ATP-binding protein [Paracoccaceae bacterium]
MPEKNGFHFEISLSVLNHLGRNLYRNFITVLGEAISNSWDADARNVWITIDRENSSFVIKDDGNGMTAEDFQNKFLKIGYSKRKDGTFKTKRNRPYIGAKGIGKLALFSCADKISVFTKTKDTDYVGGVIDNSGLDAAINDDMIPEQYPLEGLDFSLIDDFIEGHVQGTIIHFNSTKEHIRSTIEHMRKLIAMTFRFSVIDKDFKIHVNGQEVTIEDLKDLGGNTEFCWVVNDYSDDYIEKFKGKATEPIAITTALNISGYLATVVLPKHLKIAGTDQRATIDLFVNGRLREKNIIRHIPTQRIPESYMYGQFHFNGMDSPGYDPFTTSREGVKENDQKFQELLKYLKNGALPKIFDEWDSLRLQRGKEGDGENTTRATKKSRSVKTLYTEAQNEYKPPADAPKSDQVDIWLKELKPDAEFNISAYVDCFLSENLVRKYMSSESIPLTEPARNEVNEWRNRERDRKNDANISFNIRKDNDDLSYLGLDMMAKSIEDPPGDGRKASLVRDAMDYKPVRNAVGHTGLLTQNAKDHLVSIFENIKGRIRTLLKD